MKYYIIAGEASGDLYGAELAKAIKNIDKNAILRGFGGNKMAATKVDLVRHYKDMAFMGIFEVIKNIKKIRQNFAIAKDDINKFSPNAVILIDYPGFNLKLAKYLKSKELTIFYFIPPKVWAWKKKRIYQLKKYTDKIFVIFPFEVNFYKKFGITVEYFGNPLIDIINEKLKFFNAQKFRQEYQIPSQKKIVALLPGSRLQEISRVLPYYEQLTRDFPNINFILAGISTLKEAYKINPQKNLHIIYDKTYEILSISDAAVVVSGTATLETAILKIPQIVVYIPGFLTYFIGKALINIPYISLVNIIAGKKVVPEIIQHKFYARLSYELNNLLNNKEIQGKMKQEYQKIISTLKSNNQNKVIENIAEKIISFLREC